MVLTNSGTPNEVDGRGQADCITVWTNDGEVTGTALGRRRNIRGRVIVCYGEGRVVYNLGPSRRGNGIGEVRCLECADIGGEGRVAQCSALAICKLVCLDD